MAQLTGKTVTAIQLAGLPFSQLSEAKQKQDKTTAPSGESHGGGEVVLFCSRVFQRLDSEVDFIVIPVHYMGSVAAALLLLLCASPGGCNAGEKQTQGQKEQEQLLQQQQQQAQLQQLHQQRLQQQHMAQLQQIPQQYYGYAAVQTPPQMPMMMQHLQQQMQMQQQAMLQQAMQQQAMQQLHGSGAWPQQPQAEQCRDDRQQQQVIIQAVLTALGDDRRPLSNQRRVKQRWDKNGKRTQLASQNQKRRHKQQSLDDFRQKSWNDWQKWEWGDDDDNWDALPYRAPDWHNSWNDWWRDWSNEGAGGSAGVAA